MKQNKITKPMLVEKLIELSKTTDYVFYQEGNAYNFTWNENKSDQIIVEFGLYYDTKGCWLQYHTEDIAKYYQFNSIETMFIKNLFGIKYGVKM